MKSIILKIPSKLVIQLILFVFIIGQSSAQNTKQYDARMNLVDAKLKLLDAKLDVALAELKDYRISLLEKNQPLSQNMLATSPVDSEMSQDSSNRGYHNAFMLNPGRLLEGSFAIAYERKIKENLSVEGTIMVTYAGSAGISKAYIRSQSFALFDEASNSFQSYDGKLIRGWGAILQFKNYLLSKATGIQSTAPLGFYASPRLMYRKIQLIGTQLNMVDDEYQEKEVLQNLDVASVGVILGGKFTVAEVFVIDIYAGGVMRLSKYFRDNGLTKFKDWNNIDYSGVLPTIGLRIGILK